MEKVVVTGLGVASPLGGTVESFWQGLLKGSTGVRKLKDEKYQSLPTQIGARVADQILPRCLCKSSKSILRPARVSKPLTMEEWLWQPTSSPNNTGFTQAGSGRLPISPAASSLNRSRLSGYRTCDLISGSFFLNLSSKTSSLT